MDYAFTDIFDIPRLTELCEHFTSINGTVTALLDLDGNVHIKTGWQRICTEFHRTHPESARRCHESDTTIANSLQQGEKYTVYQCKNGLVDIAVPIFVDGQHVANFFTGQFLFQQPDKAYFSRQANALGVELIPYMDALRHVPVFGEDEIKKIVSFLVILAQTIGEMGKARVDVLRLRDLEHKQNQQLKKKTKELTMAKNALEKLAAEDALTGLLNRRSFDQALSREFLRAKRYQHSLVLCLFDLDKFKAINDTYGHSVGDEILRQVARIVVSGLRNTDIVCRIGGDEFAILFPEANGQIIDIMLEKIRETIAGAAMQSNGQELRVSCSFGTACIQDSDDSGQALINRADKALYYSKNAGRNRIGHADQSIR